MPGRPAENPDLASLQTPLRSVTFFFFFSCKKFPNGTVLFNGEQDFMDLPLAIEVQDSIYIDVPGEIERLTTDSREIFS